MPRHSVRNSISRPFLPIKHALLVRNKTERGISSDSPSIQLARALVESALSHSSNVTILTADSKEVDTRANSAVTSGEDSEMNGASDSEISISSTRCHVITDNDETILPRSRTRQTSTTTCNSYCKICNDEDLFECNDDRLPVRGSQRESTRSNNVENEDYEEEFSFDLNRPMGKARLKNYDNITDNLSSSRRKTKSHTRGSKSLDLSSIATRLVRRASSLSLRTNGLDFTGSSSTDTTSSYDFTTPRESIEETSDEKESTFPKDGKITTRDSTSKTHRPRSKSISVLPSATATSSALSTIRESTDEDELSILTESKKSKQVFENISPSKISPRRRSRAGSMLVAIPETNPIDNNVNHDNADGVDPSSSDEDWEVLSLRRGRKSVNNDQPIVLLGAIHRANAFAATASRRREISCPQQDSLVPLTITPQSVPRFYSTIATVGIRGEVNQAECDVYARDGQREDHSFISAINGTFDTSIRSSCTFPASPSTALDVWTASLYESIRSSKGTESIDSPEKDIVHQELTMDISYIQFDNDDSGFASIEDTIKPNSKTRTRKPLDLNQETDLSMNGLSECISTTSTTPPKAPLPRIPTLALISPMGTLRRYISCPDGILTRSSSGATVIAAPLSSEERVERNRGRPYTPEECGKVEAFEYHQQHHHKQESSINTFMTAKSTLSSMNEKDLWPPPRELFAALFASGTSKEYDATTPSSAIGSKSGARSVSKRVSFSASTDKMSETQQRPSRNQSRQSSYSTVKSCFESSQSHTPLPDLTEYVYNPSALNARSALQLVPRDLNTDLEVKPWMVVMPRFVLDDLAVGVRDWDRDKLETSLVNREKNRMRSF